MAGNRGLWSWVAGLVSPRDASAEIVGGPQEMADLAAIEAANEARAGQYLPDMQQRILARARAHPQTVTLRGYPAADREGSGPGDYERWSREVGYNQELPLADLAHVLPHELLHFLSQYSTRPLGTAGEHAVMGKVLGSPPYPGAQALEGYQPPALTPEEETILRVWLGGK